MSGPKPSGKTRVITARLLGGQIMHGWPVNASGYPMKRQSLKKLIKMSTFAFHNELHMENAKAMLFLR